MLTITQPLAQQIARLALDGYAHWTHEAIGREDGDINAMQSETGGELILRAHNDSEVAVYQLPSGELVLVADANGPVLIRNAQTL